MARKKPQPQQTTPRPRDAKGRFITSKVATPVKVTSTKKTAPPVQVERVKNEAKVKAGKIRQAGAIKDERGRFASKYFVNEVKKTILATKKIDVSKINSDQTEKIDKLLQDAKVKPEQIKKFYDANKEIFEDLKQKGKLKGTSKNSNQIETAIRNYKGKLIVIDENGNEKELTSAQVNYKLIRLKNALQSNINAVDFSIRPTLTLDGKMILKIPSATAVLKGLREKLGLTSKQSFDEVDSLEIAEALDELLKEMYEDESDINFYIS